MDNQKLLQQNLHSQPLFSQNVHQHNNQTENCNNAMMNSNNDDQNSKDKQHHFNNKVKMNQNMKLQQSQSANQLNNNQSSKQLPSQNQSQEIPTNINPQSQNMLYSNQYKQNHPHYQQHSYNQHSYNQYQPYNQYTLNQPPPKDYYKYVSTLTKQLQQKAYKRLKQFNIKPFVMAFLIMFFVNIFLFVQFIQLQISSNGSCPKCQICYHWTGGIKWNMLGWISLTSITCNILFLLGLVFFILSRAVQKLRYFLRQMFMVLYLISTIVHVALGSIEYYSYTYMMKNMKSYNKFSLCSFGWFQVYYGTIVLVLVIFEGVCFVLWVIMLKRQKIKARQNIMGNLFKEQLIK